MSRLALRRRHDPFWDLDGRCAYAGALAAAARCASIGRSSLLGDPPGRHARVVRGDRRRRGAASLPSAALVMPDRHRIWTLPCRPRCRALARAAAVDRSPRILAPAAPPDPRPRRRRTDAHAHHQRHDRHRRRLVRRRRPHRRRDDRRRSARDLAGGGVTRRRDDRRDRQLRHPGRDRRPHPHGAAVRRDVRQGHVRDRHPGGGVRRDDDDRRLRGPVARRSRCARASTPGTPRPRATPSPTTAST